PVVVRAARHAVGTGRTPPRFRSRATNLSPAGRNRDRACRFSTAIGRGRNPYGGYAGTRNRRAQRARAQPDDRHGPWSVGGWLELEERHTPFAGNGIHGALS